MAGHGEEPAFLDYPERLGPVCNNNFSDIMEDKYYYSPEEEVIPVISMEASNTDPLSTLESLENTTVLGSLDRLPSAVDRLGSPVSTVQASGFVEKTDRWNLVSNSDPLSTLDHLEKTDAECDDSLNTVEPYVKMPDPLGLEPFADSTWPASNEDWSRPFNEGNGKQANSSVDCLPGPSDESAGLGEAKPVPNYMSVHRKQPKRSAMVPKMDKRTTQVAAILQGELGLSNTNPSNEGLASLGYIEDGYSTISKYRDDKEDEDGDSQKPPAPSERLPEAVLRQHKNPTSDSISCTTRYSSCASGLEINTSRQKLLRHDKVRFGTLDPRKLEDVTPSKFVDGRYVNPWDTWTDPSLSNAIKWMCMRRQGRIPSKEILDQTLPVLTPDPCKIRAPPPSGINVTWIGHASLLVQFDGVSILTDPIFSSYCGPTSLLGVRRYRPVPCSIHMLPKVHAVVISHSHYDHLDLPTVVALNNWYGSALRWFVPLGLMDWFTRTGVENVIELDWWQENCIPSHSDVTFAFTPSQHWSQRTAFDKQKSLWGSWSVIGPNHSFFFAGDTGYCKAFKEIGQRYGPFDVAAIPIGAYLPRFFLSPQHVDPTQAVQIHLDVQARQSVGIHWGTFELGKEPYLAPREDLKIALDKEGLSDQDFFTMKHGETKLLAEEEDATLDTT